MEIRNNRVNILLSCLVALTTWCFTACDDSMGGDTVPALGFPTDTLVVDAFPGKIVPVSFNVGYNWKLNSDREWCRVNGEDKSFGGKAGANTVNFVVSDLGNLFEDDEATITLHMNNEKRVIAIITRRSTKDYDVQVNYNGQLLVGGESIVIGDSSRLVLGLEPNFKMDLLRMTAPTWIRLERREKSLIMNVDEDSLRYTINRMEDSLRMFKDSTFYRAFHVEYVGMNPREIYVGSQLESPLIVSRDAKRAHVAGTRCQMPVSFTITALKDEYEIITLNSYKNVVDGILTDSERWFTIDDDHRGNVALSVTESNTGKDRTADIFALPQPIADSLSAVGEEAVIAFFYDTTEDMTDIKEGAKKYFLAQVTQDGEYDITITPETQWGLKVTMDGKEYFDAILGDTVKAPMKVEIESTRGYKLICADYNGKYTPMSVEDSWLNIEDNQQGGKGNVNVSFDANDGAERTLLLFALPLSFVESMEPDSENYYKNLSTALFPTDSLIEDQYAEFVVAKFTQEANPENAIKVLRGGRSLVEVSPETDSEWLKIAKDKGVPNNKVFRCSMKLAYYYQIKPLIHRSVWEPTIDTLNWVPIQTESELKDSVDVRDKIEIYGKSGKLYEAGVDYKMESMLMEEVEGPYYLVQIYVEKVDNVNDFRKINEDFIIYFINDIDTDGDEKMDNVEYVKALVVDNSSKKKE